MIYRMANREDKKSGNLYLPISIALNFLFPSWFVAMPGSLRLSMNLPMQLT